MKLLILGDVSRSASCDYLAEKLWIYRKENEIDFAVVNGENSAEGNGIDKTSAQRCFLQALMSSQREIMRFAAMMRRICLRRIKMSCGRQTFREMFRERGLF